MSAFVLPGRAATRACIIILTTIAIRSTAQPEPLGFPVSIFSGAVAPMMYQRAIVRKLGICAVRIGRTSDSIRQGHRQVKEYELASFPMPSAGDTGSAFVLAFTRHGDTLSYDQQYGLDSGLSFMNYTSRNQPRIRQSVKRMIVVDSATGESHLHTTIWRTTFHAWGTPKQAMRTIVRNHPADSCSDQRYPEMITRMRRQNRRLTTYTRLTRSDPRFDRFATATISMYRKRFRTWQSFSTSAGNINAFGKPKRNLRRSLRTVPPDFGMRVLRASGWNARSAQQWGLERNAAAADRERVLHDSDDQLQSAFFRRKDSKGRDLFLAYSEKRYDGDNRIVDDIELGRGAVLTRVLSYRYDEAERLSRLDVWNLAAAVGTVGWAALEPAGLPQLQTWSFFYNSAAQVVAAERKLFEAADGTEPAEHPAGSKLPLRFTDRFEFAYGAGREMDMFTRSRQLAGEATIPASRREAYELRYDYCPGR